MKFIIIAEEFPPSSGGVATYSLRLAKMLFRLGKLEAVISLSKTPVPTSKYDFPFFHVSIPTRKYGAYKGDSFVLSRKVNSLLFNLRKHYKLKYKNPVHQVLEKIPRSKNTIILYTYAFYHRALILQNYQQFKIPFWILYHGLDIIEAKKNNDYFIEINQLADKVIFNSKATQRLFQQYNFSTHEEVVLLPGQDIGELSDMPLIAAKDLERKFKIKLNNTFTITTLCRLIKRKGIDIAIEALAPILKNKKDVQFLILGNGPEKENLIALAQKLGLANKVQFLGFVSEQEKYSLLNYADIFVMPNKKMEGDFEGFGAVFSEAMFFKNIIIGGKADGVTEAIRESAGRLSFDFNQESSKESLLNAIHFFYKHPEKMEQLQQDNYKHLCAAFDVEKLFLALLEKDKILELKTVN